MSTPLHVCAAVAIAQGRLLLATRRPGGHLAGRWEFPGGKQEPRETAAECIRRELHEELNLQVKEATPLFSLLHHYPEKSIRLCFMRCELSGDLSALRCLEGQQAAWFSADDLHLLALAPADLAALNWLTHGGAATPELQVIDKDGTAALRQWLRSGAAASTQELIP
jgi:8-oxo-dGTP diphosphatase